MKTHCLLWLKMAISFIPTVPDLNISIMCSGMSRNEKTVIDHAVGNFSVR